MRIQGTVFERIATRGAGGRSRREDDASPPRRSKALRGIETLIDHDALKDLFAQSKADDPSTTSQITRRRSDGRAGPTTARASFLLDLSAAPTSKSCSRNLLSLPEIADAVRRLDDAKLDVEHVDMMLRYLPDVGRARGAARV